MRIAGSGQSAMETHLLQHSGIRNPCNTWRKEAGTGRKTGSGALPLHES